MRAVRESGRSAHSICHVRVSFPRVLRAGALEAFEFLKSGGAEIAEEDETRFFTIFTITPSAPFAG